MVPAMITVAANIFVAIVPAIMVVIGDVITVVVAISCQRETW